MAQGQHIADGERRLTRLRESLQRDIVALLRRLDTSKGALVSTADALQNAVMVRAQVMDLLRVEGGPVAMSIAERKAEDAAIEALRGRKPKAQEAVPLGSITTEAEALATIRGTTSGLVGDMVPVWENAADTIRQAIDRGVNTGGSLADLEAIVAERLSVARNQASVVVEAAIRGAVTQATVMAAERAGQAAGEQMGYLYDGPEDSKTRPFCEPLVGRVFTLQALRALDNGQGLPVETHRGGYNCRHRLSPILLSDAVEEGYEVVR